MKKTLILVMVGLSILMTACGESSVGHEEAVSVQKAGKKMTIRDKKVLSGKKAKTAKSKTEDKAAAADGKGAAAEVPTIYESAWDRAYDHLVGTEFTGDLGELFEELQDIDIDGDGLTDAVWFTVDTESDTPSSGIEVKFGNGNSVEAGGMQIAPNLDLIVTFRDIDGNGTNEILAVSYIESTGGPMAMDVFLFRLESDDWVLYSLWDNENNVTYMSDEENQIDDFIGDGYPTLRDAELTENGVALLYDLGRKDGPTTYLDYFGVEGVLAKDNVEVVKVSKKVAEQYWPVDVEISKKTAMPE